MNPRLRRLTLAIPLLIVLGGVSHAFESDRLSVERSGSDSGSAILLIPGLNSSPRVWSDMLENLHGFDIHRVHVRGFAGLPADANASRDILPALAEEIARYIEEEELENLTLAGHSMGGLVATMLASRHPHLVDRLMVIDIPAYFGDIMGIGPDQIAAVAETMRAAALSKSVEERDSAEVAFIEAGVLTETQRPLAIEDMRSSDPGVAAQALYEIMVTDLRQELVNIAAETIVVFAQPAQAPELSPEAVTGFYMNQYGTIPDVTFEYLPGSGHFVMLDQPRRLAELIEELVR